MLTRAGAVLTAGFLLVACSSSGSPPAQLRTTALKSDGAGLAVTGIRVGAPVTFMDGDLCTTGSRPIAITSVTPLSSTGHVTVAGWGVRPDTGGYAEYRTSAHAIGAQHTPIRNRCGARATTELDVQLRAASPTATVRTFRVDYAGGHVDTWLAVAMCSPAVSSGTCGSLVRSR